MMSFIPSSPPAKESSRRKGTKLRATCDACKDAKVRCNRDVPTCYRCQNQKLNCVYNLSGRMGRPRRNRSDAEPGGAGVEDEQVVAQAPTHCETGGSRGDTATADQATLRGGSCGKQAQEHSNRHSPFESIDATDHNGHRAGPNLNDAGIQNSSSMSSLMDPFGSPHDYDPNQLQTPTGLSDFDQMAEFDFLDAPGPSIPPGSNSSRTSHWMRPRAASILDGDSTREQSHTSRPVATSLSDPSADTLTEGDMVLIHGLEERPFSSFEAAFDLDTTHARGNSGQGTPSAAGKHGENGAAPSQSATCECYQTILQNLSNIDENQSDIFSSTIDVALMLEQCIHGHIAKVLECGICAIKRPTILLLLAIIVDNVVCMLESSSRFNSSSSPAENSSSNHSSNNHDPPTAPISFRTPQVADMTGGGKGGASLATRTAADKPPLFVGNHEILSEEKNRFLKQLLQGRLSSLSAMLRQLMPYMHQSSPQNSNSRHGRIMMAETYKRLQSVIGRVELWDG